MILAGPFSQSRRRHRGRAGPNLGISSSTRHLPCLHLTTSYSLSARQAWLPSTPPVSGWFPGSTTVQTRRPTTCAAPHRLSVSVGERKRNGPSPWAGRSRTEGPTIETGKMDEIAIEAASGTMVEAVLAEAVLAGAVLGATTGVGGSGGVRHLSVTASESASSGAVRRIARDLAPRLRTHPWQARPSV